MAGVVAAWGLFSGAAWVQAEPTRRTIPEPPSIVFGQLFEDVQLSRIFPDSKTFVDMVPKSEPNAILAKYAAAKNQPGFDLAAFVNSNFLPPGGGPIIEPAAPGEPVSAYISRLWDSLTQAAMTVPQYSSLLPLPHPYVVPGGRFREVYYWDSYFTMLGLEADGRHDLARNMVDNFAYEIDTYGHVPNGNRTYYLSRSQPPFFSLMVGLIAGHEGDAAYARYLPQLLKEYEYWMAGEQEMRPGQAYQHVVRLADGTVLNRYWDARDVPRDESYAEDVQTARQSDRPAAEVYRNLRATAESGFDFSSRWLADGRSLATVRTLSIAPVDLNSLLVHLERTIARAYQVRGELARCRLYELKALRRAWAINRLMWDESQKLFTDYLWGEGKQTRVVSAATAYPLFLGVATRPHGELTVRTIRKFLLMPNGVATTLVESGQQWDQPNGWAPLQWIAINGVVNYGHRGLARAIAGRWIKTNLTVFRDTRKLVEKYHLFESSGGGGGEYTTQIGFGWTNGVLTKLMDLYPADRRITEIPVEEVSLEAAE
ncbi:alpha,alpha-trehalase TreA [Inquilinus sp. OTU3971]|uniref:alpha,alpha-trehalase TreA n=1 Tax=Inquilinus sp. OTU3971 TaxID=3043855 RepID=UPI00313BA26E